MHAAVAPPGTRHGDDDDEASLVQLLLAFWSTLRRRWFLVAVAWLAVLLPMFAYAVTAVPTYTAVGSVQVSDGAGLMGANPLMELMGGAGGAEVQTEVEIMRRREFRAHVLNRLGLQIIDPNQDGVITLSSDTIFGNASPVDPRLHAIRSSAAIAAIPENVFKRTPLTLSASTDRQLRAVIGDPDEDTEVLDFAIGELLDHPRLKLQFSEAPLAVGDSIELEILPEGELLKAYNANIGVSSLGTIREPTNIVQIAVTDTDRETARAIVATMMDHYLERTLEWQSKSASQAAEFIEGQLEEIRQNLLTAEEKMKDFSEQNNAIQLDTQAKVAIENAAELEAQRIQLELQERTIGSVLGRIRGGKAARASLTSNFFDDPVLAESVALLTEAETRYETLKADLTPAHPQVQQLERALVLHRQEVGRLMRSAQRNLTSQKERIQGELDDATEAMSAYPDKQLELARLMRDMEVSQRLYTMLLEKHEEAEIMKASTTTDKRIVDAASLPHEKTAPQRARLLAFGMFGGLLLGVGAAFTSHMLQRRLDTVEAVREMVPFPVYGTVPEVANAAERLTIVKMWQSPNDPAPEAFRALGVGVTLIPGEADHGRLVMVVSSQPGEGKSTIASNLAVSLGRSGKRVLLIDLDLRKPVQHRVWGVAREPGYSDLIGQSGKAEDLGKVAHEIEAYSTTVLTAGTRLPDTVAAIMAPSLAKMLEAWREAFDYVVLDAPPAFVAETTALAQHADLVLLVARPGQIERQNLGHAIEALDRVDVPKGLVLNAVGRKHTEYYYGHGYYYYGSSYGEGGQGKADKSDRAAS